MISIIIENGKAKVYTPYNAEFVTEIKKIGGARWRSNYWEIPENAVDVIRKKMLDIYGYNDISENETVTLKVTANEDIYADKSAVVFLNKTLANAFGRDSGAKVGTDVILISGRISSGGSRANWESEVHEGAVFELNNVSKTLYEKFLQNPDSTYTVELIENKVDRTALAEEKERLLARIAEIDKLLEDE